MEAGDGGTERANRARCTRVLHQRAEAVLRKRAVRIADLDLYPERLGSCLHHRDGLGQGIGVDQEHAAFDGVGLGL